MLIDFRLEYIMKANQKLNNALKEKDDEFYTQLSDIEKELQYYTQHFEGKIIFCNCDDYKRSNFFKFFAKNFNQFSLKKLFTMNYEENKEFTYLIEINEQIDDIEFAIANNDIRIKKQKLSHNGDFRNKESKQFLKLVDIVITNPPFSLFREFVDILIKNQTSFLIVGNNNAISYKNCFHYIAKNQMWLGFNCLRWFYRPQGDLVEASRSFWYTNLDIQKRHSLFPLQKKYDEKLFTEYDNYMAIEVPKTKDIPFDYQGVMGVPITFLEKYNPQQFEILGMDFCVKDGLLNYLIKSSWTGKLDRAYLNGKRMFSRVLIKNKTLSFE